MLDRLLSIKGKPIIFVTHDPPFSFLDTAFYKKKKHKNKRVLGVYPAKPGEKGALKKHVGNKILKELILKHKPLLYLYGHIHESKGAIDLLSKKPATHSNHLLINGGFRGLWLIEVSSRRAEILKSF